MHILIIWQFWCVHWFVPINLWINIKLTVARLYLSCTQDRQQQVKHLMPIKTYIAECLDKIQGVIRGIYSMFCSTVLFDAHWFITSARRLCFHPCLFVCLFVYLFVCLFVCLSVCKHNISKSSGQIFTKVCWTNTYVLRSNWLNFGSIWMTNG